MGLIARTDDERCQHPQTGKFHSKNTGQCRLKAVGVYTVPEHYAPINKRTGYTLPARRVRLCVAHRAQMQAFDKTYTPNIDEPKDRHSARCTVCQRENHQELCLRWSQWFISTRDVCRELGVTEQQFYRHVEYYGLMDKKASRVNTKRALVIAAEKGFGAGGHNVRTALTALQQLSKERGDVEEVRHTVTGVIGTVDLTKLTEKQLAEMAAKLAQELDKQAAENSQGQLPSGIDDDDAIDAEVIDLPASAVKVAR